ncbi:MAG: hypothetical protein IJT95_04835, partial [Abditibacteriota bacterium]|nr:hypothetical protein [Abditibacteriota bacterium]
KKKRGFASPAGDIYQYTLIGRRSTLSGYAIRQCCLCDRLRLRFLCFLPYGLLGQQAGGDQKARYD